MHLTRSPVWLIVIVHLLPIRLAACSPDGVIYSHFLFRIPAEPTIKRAVAFIDGQNLFHSAKHAFGHAYPNYDVLKLAESVCAANGWQLKQVRFYTGIRSQSDSYFWHSFWTNKLLAMSRAGVHDYSRPVRYRNKTVRLPEGSSHSFLVGEEKGIDVRIAVDTIGMAHRKEYDVGVIFSQDQDLSEVADEIRVIAHEQDRWIKLASAFPSSPAYQNIRGINGTDWLRIDRAMYDACIDPRDYRPTTRQ